MDIFQGSWHIWNTFPALTLGIYLSEEKAKELEENIDEELPQGWFPVSHSAGGLDGHQHFFILKPLTPTYEFGLFMEEMQFEWLGSCVENPCNESDLNRYASLVRSFGGNLDCEKSIQFFEEGIYPLDISEDSFDIVCCDGFSSQDQYFSEDSFLLNYIREHDLGVFLFILGANCD